MTDIKPSISRNGVPYCSEEACPSFDGRRCYRLGCRPTVICEPAVVEIIDEVVVLRRLVNGQVKP